MDAFFADYSLVPLMVQQNYLKAQLTDAPQQYMWLDRMSKAADAIVDGDLVRGMRDVGMPRRRGPDLFLH